MKKMLSVALLLAVIPTISFAGITCNPGTYRGKLWSVVPGLNGKSATLKVNQEENKCVMHFKTEGSNEIWEISGNVLSQKEYNYTGKTITQQYDATLNRDKYVINCKNRTKNDCDGGIDHRNYWQLQTGPKEIIYSVYGVGTDKKNDSSAIAKKRHEFTFKLTTKK